jgi:regulator of sigma E protease
LTVFFGILSFVVILAVLILVHELGHFSTAKLFGVRVDEFGLGFPPRLKTWRRGGTLYSLNAIPLGGFVRMLGENGDDVEPDSFGAKPQWQRLLILTAGPGMNLLLAIVIAFVAFTIGSPRGITVITQVSAGSPALAAGLRANDTILAVDGRHVRYLSDLQSIVQTDAAKHPGQLVSIRVRRGSIVFTTMLVPRTHPPHNQGAMGITLGRTVNIAYSPGVALRRSIDQLGTIIATVPLLIGSLSQHNTANLSGPIGIAHETTQVVSAEPITGPGFLIQLMAVLSASLGVLNLLPFPALDGGRIVFVLISWIRRRNLDPEIEGVIHMVGMAALLVLIMVISYNDLIKWLSGQL